MSSRRLRFDGERTVVVGGAGRAAARLRRRDDLVDGANIVTDGGYHSAG